MLSKKITESSIILYISNGTNSVYLKLQDTHVRPQSMNIQSATYFTKAEITGYINPVLKYEWMPFAINTLG